MSAVQTQIARITNEVSEQADLINQILLATAGKAIPSGGNTTATADDILSGKTAYNSNGDLLTGTILSQAALTITPGTANQTVAAGKYLQGAITVTGDANLKPENIAAGVTIFGVTGTHEGSGGGGGGSSTAGVQYNVGTTAPEDTNLFWVDSGNGNLLKVYDATTSTWEPVSAAYG